MPRPANDPQQLLVEGKNDQHVIWNLCESHSLPANFKVEVPGSSGGIEELIRDIPSRIQQSTLRTLGIVVDADSNAISRWWRVQNALSSTSASMPAVPVIGGWVADTDGPSGSLRLGIWVMPNNADTGVLEDFVMMLIPDADDLVPHARVALANIEAASIQRYSVIHQSKALIHTWLAWQETPGNPMGTAIGAGHLRADAALAVAFIAWLRRLFDPSPSSQAV
jgi:Protein of unknown function (DUF3226)